MYGLDGKYYCYSPSPRVPEQVLFHLLPRYQGTHWLCSLWALYPCHIWMRCCHLPCIVDILNSTWHSEMCVFYIQVLLSMFKSRGSFYLEFGKACQTWLRCWNLPCLVDTLNSTWHTEMCAFYIQFLLSMFKRRGRFYPQIEQVWWSWGCVGA